MNDLTHISLFTGIGGFDLAAEWAGFRTIAMCELDPFCQEVLAARFGAVEDPNAIRCSHREDEAGEPEVRVKRDAGARDEHGLHRPTLIPDIRDFGKADGTRFRGATLLTGGFPCQPFSHAGKRGGKRDERFLWKEMLRVISEARPTWCIAENVDGLTGMVHFDEQLPMDRRKYTEDEMAAGRARVGELRERVGRGLLDEVVEDLEKIGYEVAPVVVPAAAVGACHLRYRVWIVGRLATHAEGVGTRGGQGAVREAERRPDDGLLPRPVNPDSDAPDAVFARTGEQAVNLYHGEQEAAIGQIGLWHGPHTDAWDIPWIEVATRFCRVDDGLPAWVHARRVQRLKALGNAIVPAVAYEIIKAIAEIERGR